MTIIASSSKQASGVWGVTVLAAILVVTLSLTVAQETGASSAGDSATSFARTDLDVGSIPTSVAVSEFNSDGVPDFAVVNYSSGSVFILLGDGGGGFVLDAEVPVGVGPIAATAGDLDEDGYIDLVVVNYNGDSVALLLGNGRGQFSSGGFVTVGSIPASAVVGDFNGDGVPDLAVANLGGDTVSILLGDGALGYARTDVAVGRQPRMLRSADLNADGVSDLGIANYGGATMSVLTGDGAGGFTRSDFAVGPEPRSIETGDLDGDGRPDLVVGNHGSESVSVMVNDGAGGFLRSDVGVGVHPRAGAVGDFNGDGRADIAVASNGSDTVSVLLADPTGGFTRANDVAVSSAPYGLAIGDFDQDDHPDLVVANSLASSVSVLDNLDGAPASAPGCHVRRFGSGESEVTSLGVFDLRSGLASLVVTKATNATVRLSPFPPYGAFAEVEALATKVDGTQPINVELRSTDGAGNVSTCSSAPPPTTTTTTTVPATTTTTTLPATTTTPWVTSFTPTNLRRDFSGWVGSKLTVGSSDLRVSAVGRWVVAGSAGSHVVKLVDAATGADVAGGAATVDTAGAPENAFRYGDLPGPVTLQANATYYIVSQETAGGDAWYDYDTRIVTTAAAADVGAVYAPPGTATQWIWGGGPGNGYGPLSLLYASPAAGTTTTTSSTTAPSTSTTAAPTTTTSTTIPPTTTTSTTPPPATTTSTAPTTTTAVSTTTTTTTPTSTTTAPTTTTTTAPTTTSAPSPSTTTVPPGTARPLVTSFTPTNLRNDFSGWVGSKLTVGPRDLQVTALGRWVVPGNTGNHTVKLVDAATGTDVLTGTVVTAGAPADRFGYAGVRTPATLRANTTYYLVSQEAAGGDAWYDYDTRIVTTDDAADVGAVYAFPGAPPSWISGGSAGNGYGPLSVLYTGGTAPAVTTTTLPPSSTTSSSAPTTTTTTTTTTSTSTPPSTTTVPATTTTTALAAAPTPWVTSFTPTNLRRDFSGWVGSKLTVGSSDLRVSALGRWVVAGSTGSHTVKLVDAATGTDVAGGSATVDTAGAPESAFRYGDLPAPVTLRANATYYLVSQETAGGDFWYDYDTNIVTTPAAADVAAVYAFPGTSNQWVWGGSPGHGYGPLSLLYT